MIRSMTGFASISREEAGHKVGVTAKSVNHRFLDMAIKAPASLGGIDGTLRSLVQQRLTRGRVEISISLELAAAPAYTVTINEDVLRQVSAAVDEAREHGLVTGGLTVSDLLRIPQALTISTEGPSAQTAPEPALRLVEQTVGEAIDALAIMRGTEGGFLQRDLDQRVRALIHLVDLIEKEARAAQAGLEARLRGRLAELPSDLVADAAAASQEIVRFIARSDIDEEMTRLRGHFAHWTALVDGDEPCGRKLDFLVQEMNREVNTVGSKAEGTRVPELVVTAKAELERVKEQVQNVE
ncbi:MAG: YicC family protein [Acidobacteria bacterium]|nr:MAG: YicC family protein [Acidobacteriota bacterium]